MMLSLVPGYDLLSHITRITSEINIAFMCKCERQGLWLLFIYFIYLFIYVFYLTTVIAHTVQRLAYWAWRCWIVT